MFFLFQWQSTTQARTHLRHQFPSKRRGFVFHENERPFNLHRIELHADRCDRRSFRRLNRRSSHVERVLLHLLETGQGSDCSAQNLPRGDVVSGWQASFPECHELGRYTRDSVYSPQTNEYCVKLNFYA